MVLGRVDFYFDVYRSAEAQLRILDIALDQDANLKAQLLAITAGDAQGRNQCEKNWALLLGQTRDITQLTRFLNNLTVACAHALILS
jgi:hypothetical protein